MTPFSVALKAVHDHGWYVYQAFENPSPKTEFGQAPWGVTLREATGGMIRNIAYGQGESLGEAILCALERGHKILEKPCLGRVAPEEPALDLVKALGIGPPKPIVRRA